MEQQYAACLIALLKGVVYDHQKQVWDDLLRHEADVKKYFQQIGLELFLDKSEGYAFLRQKEWDDEQEALPKLAERRPLNFMTSVLCVILRKYLLEHDAQGGSVRSIISEEEILNRAALFLPSIHDEARQQERVVSTINRIIDLGFLRKLADDDKNYEIHRIIKGYVDAQVVDDMLRKLREYAMEKNVAE